MRTAWLIVATLSAGLLDSPARAQQAEGTRLELRGNVLRPSKVDATPERIAHLKAPAGFKISAFATGLKNARILAVAPNGNVYLSRREQGDVLLLRDADNDGRADGEAIPVASRPGVHGLAIHDNKLYLATVKQIFTADLRPDGTLGTLASIIGDLPDGGQHANRTIAFGPDGMLYISVGSTCNACEESNPENATLLRASPDGGSRTIFAGGLRNTIGFAWHPQTGALWGMDHGIDFLGDDQQPEELNKIEMGKQYGWPHVWGAGGATPWTSPPGGLTREQWKAQSVPMALGYTAHAAPMQLLFYPGGAFPSEFTGDAFVTMHGSWNRSPASGYEIVRIRFAQGRPKAFEPFVSGFLTEGGKSYFARPVGLALAKDGALLMADDANGVIYHIAYAGAGGNKNAAPLEPPAGKAETARDTSVPLANAREETHTRGALLVSSSAFEADKTIPDKHSEYYDGVSPDLAWSSVGDAKSYVIIMEDPDARPITPFVHWIAWNIPPRVVHLQEGLQEQARLTEPEGLLQGRTSRGSVGYFGPRPPVNDPPHHYHFQVLALDTMLDVPAGSDRDTVLKAMKGHVLAKGELVGVFQQKVAPLK